MSANDLPNEFEFFNPSNEAQEAIASATLARVRENLTDAAMVEMVRAGVVKATDDKERCARIVSGLLTAAKFVTGLLKL